MPSLETDCRNQKAVLWTASGSTNEESEPTVNAAQEIDVRWEETRDQTTDSQGNIVEITAKVVVDVDIAEGSILWLGALDDVASPPVNLLQVVGRSKIPDVKNRNFRRVLSLKRHGALPDLA